MANVADYAISEDAFNLRDKMAEILATVVSVYESYGVPLPEKHFWTVGQPAEDCPAVVASFLQMYLGLPGDQASQPQNCNVPRTAVVDIYITRKYPIGNNGQPVPANKLLEASEWAALDSWILMEALKQFDDWGNGVPGPGVIATVSARAPRGALQSTVLNLSVVVP